MAQILGGLKVSHNKESLTSSNINRRKPHQPYPSKSSSPLVLPGATARIHVVETIYETSLAPVPEPPPAAGAPQIPALLFALASEPMLGPVALVVDFLIPILACDHKAPNASPPAADFCAVADELDAGIGLMPMPPPDPAGGDATAGEDADCKDTDEK